MLTNNKMKAVVRKFPGVFTAGGVKMSVRLMPPAFHIHKQHIRTRQTNSGWSFDWSFGICTHMPNMDSLKRLRSGMYNDRALSYKIQSMAQACGVSVHNIHTGTCTDDFKCCAWAYTGHTMTKRIEKYSDELFLVMLQAVISLATVVLLSSSYDSYVYLFMFTYTACAVMISSTYRKFIS